jgi:hypothetical protein
MSDKVRIGLILSALFAWAVQTIAVQTHVYTHATEFSQFARIAHHHRHKAHAASTTSCQCAMGREPNSSSRIAGQLLRIDGQLCGIGEARVCQQIRPADSGRKRGPVVGRDDEQKNRGAWPDI